jgi:hypothetical protein
MNSDFEGSRGVYKLYEVMRNVQVMRKDVKSPDEGGEPTCNLISVSQLSSRWGKGTYTASSPLTEMRNDQSP